MIICQHCGAEIAAQPTLSGLTVWAATVPVGAWVAPFDCVAVGGAAAHTPAVDAAPYRGVPYTWFD